MSCFASLEWTQLIFRWVCHSKYLKMAWHVVTSSYLVSRFGIEYSIFHFLLVTSACIFCWWMLFKVRQKTLIDCWLVLTNPSIILKRGEFEAMSHLSHVQSLLIFVKCATLLLCWPILMMRMNFENRCVKFWLPCGLQYAVWPLFVCAMTLPRIVFCSKLI